MLLKHPLAGPDARVLIEDDVLHRLQAYRQIGRAAREAGGVLLGYRRGEHLHVAAATVPAALDQRSRYGFVRLDPSHQARATRGWKLSGGRLDYLGDWHTHPEADPQPSGLDCLEWRKLCLTVGAGLLFVVVGTEGWWFGVGEGVRLARAVDRLSERGSPQKLET
jgi:integrative and conjugative element protein (TIGR02256 family)